MKVNILDSKGKETSKKADLSDNIWAVKPNHDLVAQALYVYRFNQKKGTAHTKTRAEVRGGGAKPWRQKGTGRARHGSRRSPIWVKGGVAFGPRSYKKYLRMPKKMNRLALKCVLSDKAKSEKVFVVDEVNVPDKKLTAALAEFVGNVAKDSKKSIVVLSSENKAKDKIYRASRNLKNTITRMPLSLNIYDATNAQSIIIEEAALKEIEERLQK